MQKCRFALHALCSASAALFLALVAPSAIAGDVKLDVPYIPTHYDAVHRILEMAGVGPNDTLVDLGSGDGRIVVQAARDWGVTRAVGIDIDPERIAEANENARAAGVSDRVSFIQQDLFEMDFSSATVVTMYLLEALNLKLRPVILDSLAPGTRVVSHVFGMGEWEPDRTVVARGIRSHMWIVPAKVEGDWRIELPDGTTILIKLSQDFQHIEGSYLLNDITMGMSFAELTGSEIRFSAHDLHFAGIVHDEVMTGLPGPGVVVGWRATRVAPRGHD